MIKRFDINMIAIGIIALFIVGAAVVNIKESKKYVSSFANQISSGIDDTIKDDTRLNKKEKLIAITFDDGPDPLYTQRILEMLDEYGIEATFFVIGKSIEGNEELIKTMHEKGHIIGNHTFNHVQLNCLDIDKAIAEINLTNEKIKSITGEEVVYIRPPFGEWSKTLEERTDMITVFWDIDTLDWTTNNVEGIIRNATRQVNNMDIILFHDVYGSSVEAVEKVIIKFKNDGYKFVTVDTLYNKQGYLALEMYNWVLR